MSAINHRAICDCSRPATVKLGSAWVCEQCFSIDSARLRMERECRERARREKLRGRLDSFFSASQNSSPLHNH